MSMKLFEMKQERAEIVASADKLIAKAESEKREFTASEQTLFDAGMKEADRLTALITPLESRNTLGAGLGLVGGPFGASGPLARPEAGTTISPETNKLEYMAALHGFIQTGGKAHGGELRRGGRHGRLSPPRFRGVYAPASR